MRKPRIRLGLLTGGGDCPGLNAAIRAVVKSAHEQRGAVARAVGTRFGDERAEARA